MQESDLPNQGVLVDVAYSTLNYKDGLAFTNAAPICQKFPMVCGIDLAGTVAESADDRFKPGDIRYWPTDLACLKDTGAVIHKNNG